MRAGTSSAVRSGPFCCLVTSTDTMLWSVTVTRTAAVNRPAAASWPESALANPQAREPGYLLTTLMDAVPE